MVREPKFSRSDGRLCLLDTDQAKAVKLEQRGWEKPTNIFAKEEERAKKLCRENGGDDSDPKQWMGLLRMEWGAFRGETYLWMMENTPGYCGYMANEIDSHNLLKTDRLHMFKWSFLKYMKLFPEGREIIQLKRKKITGVSHIGRSSGKERKTHKPAVADFDEFDTNDDKELMACMEKFEDRLAAQSIYEKDQIWPSPSGAAHVQIQIPESEQNPVTEQLQSSHVDDIPFSKGWKKTVPLVDQTWISKTFYFYGTKGPQFDFTRVKKLWYDPPQPSLARGMLNKQDCYFGHRLFLWMPKHLFHYNLKCIHPGCEGSLINTGVHHKTRMVLDVSDYYILVGEDYGCNKCKRKMISWSQGILDQLDLAERSKFPCLLTEQYACDLKIVRMMRQRTLGNSSSLVCKQVAENHGETYVDKCRQYVSHFKTFKTAAAKGLVHIPAFQEPPSLMDTPKHRWFMKVYQLDVLSRLDYELAELTSITGNILKIDSTKKITYKLAGDGKGTANWATNVGNEHGQVLMCVLTEGEGEGLQKMINGIMARYRHARVPPPAVLYTDRDCCGRQAIHRYFGDWPLLKVRLDVWHFMRRFPNGCTTDKHQLYGPFMARLSSCIFKIDKDDYDLLKKAKRQELMKQGISSPSDYDVERSITTYEIGRHCRRATRGTETTTSLIRQLISSMDGEKGLDSSGVPLIDSAKMADIWEKQSIHIPCLQDPPGVQLYVKVSSVKKGGIQLPVYKCARGSTSLENFHLHLARFIPGTLAKDTNFQVYLLDGLFRWNQDRASEATDTEESKAVVPRTYSGPLKQHTNTLWQEVCGRPFFPNYKPPAKYTGEAVGVQYLYEQTGQQFPTFLQTRSQLEEDEDTDMEDDVDEGFIDTGFERFTSPEERATSTEIERRPVLSIPTDAEYQEMARETLIEGMEFTRPETTMPDILPVTDVPIQPSVTESSVGDENNEVVGPDNVPGYDKVLQLAKFLADLRDVDVLHEHEVQKIIHLWSQMSEFDKKRTIFPKRFRRGSWTGKFGGRGKNVVPGTEATTKAFLGPNQGPAQWPNCNRYVEATCEKLAELIPGNQKREGRLWDRWKLLLRAFHHIRQLIIKSQRVMEETDIQLPLLNRKTLMQWYNKSDKEKEQKVLLQGLDLPKPAVTGTGLPEPRKKQASRPSNTAPTFVFRSPVCAVGPSRQLKRKTPVPIQPATNRMPFVPKPPLIQSTVLPQNQLVQRMPVIFRNDKLIILPTTPSPILSIPVCTTQEPVVKKPKKYIYKNPDVVRCSKCGENRKNSPDHKSYMFSIYCANTEKITYEEWKEKIKQEIKKQKKK